MGEEFLTKDEADKGEIVIYQPDEITKLEVHLKDDTVWLSQAQISVVFNVGRSAVTKHINNIYACGELDKDSTCSILEHVGNDGLQSYHVKYFNLDMILSVGYRVNSKNAIAFRRWASSVLKEYLLSGYAIRHRLNEFEDRIDRRMLQFDKRLDEQERKMDILVHSSQLPKQGIFYDGQIYDAYSFVSGLLRKAVCRIVLIDNYIDDTVLTLMDKRATEVEAVIYTGKISKQLQLDVEKHNTQYSPIEVRVFSKAHDRFLVIDDEVYLIGASIKDLGKKWFGFTLMENTSADDLLRKI